MNLKEQLEAKKEELKSLDLTTEEGIKSGEALTEEITKLDSLVKKAEEVAKVKESIGTVEKKEEEEMDGIKSANLEELKTQKGSRSFALKAYNDPETAPTVGVTSQKVVDTQPALGVRDLFGSEAISGNALTYYALGSLAGSFSTVAQGGTADGFVDKPVSYIQDADGYYMFTCLVTGIPVHLLTISAISSSSISSFKRVFLHIKSSFLYFLKIIVYILIFYTA